MLPFQKFDKIPRLSRDIVITEKIDGTNAQIYICDYDTIHNSFAGDYQNQNEYTQDFIDQYCLYTNPNGLNLFAGSRTRWLDTSSKGDNYGFAKWVQANTEELFSLGECRHYGEWYGKGIQRNYGLDEKRFALFNVGRWVQKDYNGFPQMLDEKQSYCPDCCHVVPILYRGEFDTEMIGNTLMTLKEYGSKTVPGFMNPEGIIIYHTASGQLFKKTIIGDEKPKGQNE